MQILVSGLGSLKNEALCTHCTATIYWNCFLEKIVFFVVMFKMLMKLKNKMCREKYIFDYYNPSPDFRHICLTPPVLWSLKQMELIVSTATNIMNQITLPHLKCNFQFENIYLAMNLYLDWERRICKFLNFLRVKHAFCDLGLNHSHNVYFPRGCTNRRTERKYMGHPTPVVPEYNFRLIILIRLLQMPVELQIAWEWCPQSNLHFKIDSE